MPKVKRTNDEWRELLSEQRASGQSQEEWCEANGVNLFTLRDRASRLKKMDRASSPKPEAEQPETISAGWVEIVPEPRTEGSADIIVERGGFAITVKSGFNAELLTEVLRAVSLACC